MIALITAAVSITLVETAQSHYVDSHHRWYFRGYTASTASGTPKSDPVNIFFFRGNNSLSNIDSHIHDHAGLANVCRTHVGPLCVAHCPGGPQWLTFLNWGHPPNQPARETDKVDMARETECADDDGEMRHHIRVWDDLEHQRDTQGHGALNQWAVGAIHLDTNVNGQHKIGESWERSERWLLGKMASHCQYPHWRVLPGSTGRGHRFRNRFSDGYVSLISTIHTSAPGRCPPR